MSDSQEVLDSISIVRHSDRLRWPCDKRTHFTSKQTWASATGHSNQLGTGKTNNLYFFGRFQVSLLLLRRDFQLPCSPKPWLYTVIVFACVGRGIWHMSYCWCRKVSIYTVFIRNLAYSKLSMLQIWSWLTWNLSIFEIKPVFFCEKRCIAKGPSLLSLKSIEIWMIPLARGHLIVIDFVQVDFVQECYKIVLDFVKKIKKAWLEN